jgi:hypothetical protein
MVHIKRIVLIITTLVAGFILAEAISYLYYIINMDIFFTRCLSKRGKTISHIIHV